MSASHPFQRFSGCQRARLGAANASPTSPGLSRRQGRLLLAVKDDQPTLHEDVRSHFDTAPASAAEKVETTGKHHGRFEVRLHMVSCLIEGCNSERSCPGGPRFVKLTTFAARCV
jgi:hypothetical protein